MTRDIELKKALEDFTEEVILFDPEWTKERRIEFLLSEATKLVNQIVWWINFYADDWWNEAIYESVIRPDRNKILRILDEIERYENPIAIDYSSKITDEEIRRAKEVPLDYLSGLEFRTAGSGRKKACCPFHLEKEPSFVWYVEQNTFCCYGCGETGSVIDYLMKMRNLNFREAVNELNRR